MYNMTQKAALERARKERQEQKLTLDQIDELAEQELDKLGLTGQMNRAMMKQKILMRLHGKQGTLGVQSRDSGEHSLRLASLYK